MNVDGHHGPERLTYQGLPLLPVPRAHR